MEIFNIKNLTFSYPKSSAPALSNINLTVSKGEFILLCGQSGSGKSTLLKMLKPQLAPHGSFKGEIFFNGKSLNTLSNRESAEKIGFVMQNPETQIVTDKVYHELAFAMESLGYNKEKIRLKSGEMASFFGLSDIFSKNTNELSGGQKQLLNLASVLTLQPEVLILDEPTAQLDPLSAENFLNILKKLNRDFGITVILSEHNLEEVFDYADKVLVLDSGKICTFSPPCIVSENLKKINSSHPMLSALPAPVRIFNRLNKTINKKPPLNINQGRIFLFENFNNNIKAIEYNSQNEKQNSKKDTVLSLKNIYFRYEKNEKDVLKDFNFSLKKGEIYTLLGANGSGKSTAIKIISGILKPYHGKIKKDKNSEIAYLPQNPRTLFIKDKLSEDFEMLSRKEKTLEYAKKFQIEHLLESHPFDLSGGEFQKAAMIKLLLSKPTVMLLDEPTKGMDAFAKNELSDTLKKLRTEGITLLIVTHDTEFACAVSDRCGLLFDGNILAENNTTDFFSGNGFYTTSAAKMSKGFFENAVTCGDVVTLCKLNGEKDE